MMHIAVNESSVGKEDKCIFQAQKEALDNINTARKAWYDLNDFKISRAMLEHSF